MRDNWRSDRRQLVSMGHRPRVALHHRSSICQGSREGNIAPPETMKMVLVLTSLRDWGSYRALSQRFAALHPGLSSCVPYGNFCSCSSDFRACPKEFSSSRGWNVAPRNHKNATADPSPSPSRMLRVRVRMTDLRGCLSTLASPEFSQQILRSGRRLQDDMRGLAGNFQGRLSRALYQPYRPWGAKG
jgi:hypothetical protein